MDQYELIRTANRLYAKSIRAIAREYGHSRKTIRKTLAGLEPKYRRKQEPFAFGVDLVNNGEILVVTRRIDSGALCRSAHSSDRNTALLNPS